MDDVLFKGKSQNTLCFGRNIPFLDQLDRRFVVPSIFPFNPHAAYLYKIRAILASTILSLCSILSRFIQLQCVLIKLLSVN